jgi:hypothetical protein
LTSAALYPVWQLFLWVAGGLVVLELLALAIAVPWMRRERRRRGR